MKAGGGEERRRENGGGRGTEPLVESPQMKERKELQRFWAPTKTLDKP